ncbi:restriction endonuclease subunit S [Lactococcus lactis]|uniref:restriction endonuclease subunit S n=1 Tax=Lactococcus lactis TaxID=1358 RepID=UPI00289239BC|nr:restriction endonuclease subunit S [Lactococcus lactis]MDT2852742.1 restriction endonuclease subunit S [Lactococcus lactis]
MAKIDDSIKKKVPELRFKGFTDDWEQRKLTEIVNRVNKSSNSDVLPKVEFEDIVSGEGRLNKDISSKFDSRKGTLFEPENILYGKLRPYLKNWLFSDFEGVALGDFWVFEATDVSVPSFDYYLIQSDNYQKVANDTSGTKMPRSDWKNVSSTDFAIPSKDEQKQIGAFFKQLDNTIVLHQRRLDLLKEQKKGYLQKMFPKNGAKVPELRFAGFADDWEERKLSSGLREYTDRVIVEDDKEYYQISVRNNFGGITLRGSKMGNKIGRKRQAKINLTKYPQTLIFTRQTVEQGGIGWVDKYCDGAIVTENMPTISLDTSVFSKYFLTNLFQTRIFYKNAILDNIEGGSAQIAIHESKFLSSTLLFPNLDEQEKIGQFFKQLDDTIDLHQRKLDLLKEQKKGFLQKMFV